MSCSFESFNLWKQEVRNEKLEKDVRSEKITSFQTLTMLKTLLSSIKVIVKRRRLELMLLVFLVAGLVSSIKVTIEQKRIEELARIRVEKEAERDRLAEMAIKYPDYRDLLYRLAAAQGELGNDEAAKAAMERAEYLDPNNPELLELKQKLND